MYEVDSLNATLPLQPSTIRLLEVQPAIDPSDGIDCELRAWTLGSAPSYKALSCAWKEHQGVDQADEQQGVQREGRLGIANAPPAQSSLTVSPSLALAIRRQRRKYHSIFLWIDAVCINQADDDERTAQVALVGSIYQRASEVIIWLGQRVPEEELGEWLQRKYTQAVQYLDWSLPGTARDYASRYIEDYCALVR
jgi:hypothetical protein